MTRPHGHARSLLTASRVRKARRNGSCVLCPKPITVGQNVGLIAAGWAHLSPCIVDRRQITQHDREDDPAMADPFTIRSAQGGAMITASHNDRGLPTLAVRASGNGEPVTIAPEEAQALAAALTRRWPATATGERLP